MLIAGEITAAEEILIPAIRRCVGTSPRSFHRRPAHREGPLPEPTTIGGFALVAAPCWEDLLQIIMEQVTLLRIKTAASGCRFYGLLWSAKFEQSVKFD